METPQPEPEQQPQPESPGEESLPDQGSNDTDDDRRRVEK